MKKIGFIDYFLDEWHANNYPEWIRRENQALGLSYELSFAWAERNHPDPNGLTTSKWCEKFGVQECAEIAELCEKSDVVVILAPSNPEKHLEYAQKVFPYGKRVYIDKTFAPDTATAEQIYSLAKKYGVEFFSTSALRYAAELEPFAGKSKAILTTGGGSNLEEYIIHQAEMVVKALGTGACAVRTEAQANQYVIRVRYSDGRRATMLYANELPFAIAPVADTGAYFPVTSDYFQTLIRKILLFFENGDVDFEAEQTMEVMRIREAIVRAKANGKEDWVAL